MFAEGRPCIIINQFYSLALSVLDEPDNPPIIGLKPDGSDKQKVRPTMTPSILPPPSDPDPPQWIPTQEEDGTWTLKNVANGKFLSVEGDPTAGASVIGADSPTLWTIDIDGSGSGSSWYR